MKTIVAATDGSAPADKAIDFAAQLAAQRGAQLHLLSVVRHQALPHWQTHPTGDSEAVGADATAFRLPHGAAVPSDVDNDLAALNKALYQSAEQTVQSAQRRLTEAGLVGPDAVTTAVEYGRPAEAIVDYARRIGADLLVLGNRGQSATAGLLLGSVSDKVNHLADCTCVIVR